MRYEFAQAAREEFISTIEYYELQQSGLGLSFSEQVRAAIDRIIDFPVGQYPLISKLGAAFQGQACDIADARLRMIPATRSTIVSAAAPF